MADTTFINQLNAEMAAIVQKVQPSLVQIGNGRGGQGAGIIWNADGLILTNHHVVGRSSYLEVRLSDGREFRGQVIARDPDHDLAAISIEASNLPAITVGDSAALQAGTWVIAMGHPWGVRNAITTGMVISTTAESSGVPAALEAGAQQWVVAGLHMRPGHSGGAMVDLEGRLVGINTLINGPDVGVAVPVDTAKQFLSRATVPKRAASYV